MSARIIISKKKEYFSRGATFGVMLDGKEVTEVYDKTVLVVDEGVYAVQLVTRWKWVRTQTLIVKATDGKEVFLSFSNGIKYYSLLYATFLFSILGNIFFISGKIVRPQWYFIAQFVLIVVFIAYILFNYFLKKGEVWILKEVVQS